MVDSKCVDQILLVLMLPIFFFKHIVHDFTSKKQETGPALPPARFALFRMSHQRILESRIVSLAGGSVRFWNPGLNHLPEDLYGFSFHNTLAGVRSKILSIQGKKGGPSSEPPKA